MLLICLRTKKPKISSTAPTARHAQPAGVMKNSLWTSEVNDMSSSMTIGAKPTSFASNRAEDVLASAERLAFTFARMASPTRSVISESEPPVCWETETAME